MFSLQVGWQSLVVLYEHDESLTRLQELLRLPQVVYFVFSFLVVREITLPQALIFFVLFRFLVQAALQCFVLPGWNFKFKITL